MSEHQHVPAAPVRAGRSESGDTESTAPPVQLRAAPGGAQTDLQALMQAGGNLQMVQLAGEGGGPGDVHAAAAHGVSGGGGAMPHADAIQKSFGGHDISGVKAHVGGKASEAASAMGAEAYATGNDIAFADRPSLHTAAHEAAHVVQQRAGVSLSGGVGASGDRYEQHADQVADAVVAGRSAEPLLSAMGGGPEAGGAVQHKAVQRNDGPNQNQQNVGNQNQGQNQQPQNQQPQNQQPQVDPFWDTRLGALGLSAKVQDLKGGFSQQDLETYIATVGEPKIKDLILTKGLGAAQLKANGGADFYKTFIGCGGNTLAHVAQKDGVSGGEVKGTHDEDDFIQVLAEKKMYQVPQYDQGGINPILEPLSPKEIQGYQTAMQKYQGQLNFYNGPKNDDGNGGKKMQQPPQQPQAPVQKQKTIDTELEQGKIHSTTALTTAGVNKHDYGLRVIPTGAMRGPGVTLKTTIKGLKANSAKWQKECNEAIWDAIKNGNFGQNWTGHSSSGAQIDGYFNGGAEVATFFYVS